MYNPNQSETEAQYAAAYEDMAAFEDAPHDDSHLLCGSSLDEQFKIDLVLWTVERVRCMGLPVNAAWLLHELLFFRAYVSDMDGNIDTFIHDCVFGELPPRIQLNLRRDPRGQTEYARIMETLVDLLESVE